MMVSDNGVTEEWKDIKGYEGFYQVSNLGNVRSVERIVYYSDGRKFKYFSQKRKFGVNDGYLFVPLFKNKKSKNRYVHRLVAEAFIPNPNNKKYINHKDYNRGNNIYTNLEWVTAKENTAHSLCHFDISKIPLPSSGHRYIRWRNKRGIYEIVVKHKYVGSAKTLEEAIKKRDEFYDNE